MAYLAGTFFAKQNATQAFTNALENQNVSYSRIITTPEPLQAFLRRGVAQVGQGYYEGYYSLFDQDKNIERVYIPNDTRIRHVVIAQPDVSKVEKWAQ